MFPKEINESLSKLVDEAIAKAKTKPSKPQTIVEFDSKTDAPWRVSFSERGFSLDDTRLSFELIEDAISKRYTLTLESGTVLDLVKMQKILRYKNLY
jgi:hypothetical protein